MQKELNKKNGIVEFVSTKNMGLKLEGSNWLNFDSEGSKVSKEEMQTILNNIKKRSKVEVECDDKKFRDIKVIEEPKEAERKTTSFTELLDNFVDKYPDYNKETEIIEVNDKRAIIKVKLTMGVRKIEAIGDAGEGSIKNSNTIPHYIRMAETRAFARAIRFALGTGEVAEEEVDGNDN